MAAVMKSGFKVLPEPHQKCLTCPVRKRALFNGVAEEKLEWTEQYRATQIEAAPKQNIFLEGEPATHAYTLFEGWALVYKTLPNGKRQIMRFALPGDFLGFQPDLEGPMRYGIAAITRVVLCAFPRSSLTQMFTEHHDLALQMALLNARYMELCQHHLMGTGRQNARERIAFLLLELYYRSQMQTDVEGEAVPFPICQEEIADAVGLTTVHVNRTLKQMRSEGLIECAARRLVIKEEEKLAEIANFDKSVIQNQLMF